MYPSLQTKHRGVPIYLYSRHKNSSLGANDASLFRVEGEYRNPNDRMFTFSENFEGEQRSFHLEDLGCLGREETNGNSLDRKNYNPVYKQSVHTPHPIKNGKK